MLRNQLKCSGNKIKFPRNEKSHKSLVYFLRRNYTSSRSEFKSSKSIPKQEFDDINFNFKKHRSSISNLYIPNKDLLFINHPKYGKVYPVYIADKAYNKKNNPLIYLPLTLIFTSFNFFLLFSGFQMIPLTWLYELLYSNDLVLFSSFMLNYFLLRKYFKFIGNYDNRVKSLYLLPTGDRLILETFEGSIKRFEIMDIYEFNIRNKFKDIETKTIKWNPLFVDNDNNFTCQIKWGRVSENFFEGKTILFDYEIFSKIVSRVNIDTSIKKFKKQVSPGFYSSEEKIKILRKFHNRIWKKKINWKKLSYHYKLLRREYVTKIKKNEVKKEYDFY